MKTYTVQLEVHMVDGDYYPDTVTVGGKNVVDAADNAIQELLARKGRGVGHVEVKEVEEA